MELIERDALLNNMENPKREINDGQDYADWFSDCVVGAPTVEAVPVVHGRWIDKANPRWRAYSHSECSNCGWWNAKDATVVRGEVVLNYCPYCGSRMDGKEQA